MIKGWQKTTFIDYPPYTSSLIFLGGCNFRCPYCHNPDLVLKNLPSIDQKEILDYVKEKKQWIDACVITGGEPTLHQGLPTFISEIKKIGLLVKLDTNGTNPAMLKQILADVDYVAMDIKGPLSKYDSITRVTVNKYSIQESVNLIRESGKKYEFRTTVIPGMIDIEDMEEIGKWLSGSSKFVIQQFRNTKPMIDIKLMKIKPYSKEELENMSLIAKKYFKEVEIR